MKEYVQRDFKKYLHYYTFPKWSAANKFTILFLSAVSCVTGLTGAGLSHMNIPHASFVWHIAIFTLLPCLPYYIRGLYDVYMAYGWDINY
jgi:hypothetical protein